jgi:hypothetical protein
MSDLFTTILISFSQLLFSSRALALMANRTSHKVLHTSRAESEPRNATTLTNHVSKEKSSPSDDGHKTSSYGERSEKVNLSHFETKNLLIDIFVLLLLR